jgi:hypothetical protein
VPEEFGIMQRQVMLALLGVAVLVLAPSPAHRLQAPGDIEHVPLFQGALPFAEGEANAGGVGHAYAVSEPIEDVVAFYRQRLGAVPVPNAEELTIREENARERLQPGSVSPVWMLTSEHDLQDTDDWSPPFFETVHPERLRMALAEARSRYRPRERLSSAELCWLRATSDGEKRFRIMIVDETPREVVRAEPRTKTSISVSMIDSHLEAEEHRQ